MRNYFYFQKKPALMLAILIMASSMLVAQTAQITWTGAVDSDATNKANWDPQLDLAGDIELLIDSAKNYTNAPVFSGLDSLDIYTLTMEHTAKLTIDFDDPDVYLNFTKDRSQLFGDIDIIQGTVKIRRGNARDSTGRINVYSNGTIEARKYWMMADGDDHPDKGGYLNLYGSAKFIYTAREANYFGRFSADTTSSIIWLDTLATMEIVTNYEDFLLDKIALNQIQVAEGYEPIVEFDGISTHVWCRHLNELIVVPGDDQFGITDVPTSKVGAVQNNAWSDAPSLEWKYATQQGGPYTSFSPALTTDSVEISFSDPGKFYVVLTDGTNFSNEVVYVIGSDKVVPAPDGVQYLRTETDGAMITASVDAIITSQEWKWSTTPGEGYTSFDPAATGLEFTPSFADNGTYYVACVGSDGTNSYPSKDVMIIVDDNARDIYWKGSVSNDGMDPANWEPIANIAGNTLLVEHEDTYGDSLVISTTGHLRINQFDLLDSTATMTVDMGVDTLSVVKNSYFKGHLFVNSGRMRYRDLRHRMPSAVITVQGTGIFSHTSQFILGQSDQSLPGGLINIKDDGIFVTEDTWPLEARWSNDTTSSIVTITDNGRWMLKPGDWTASAAKFMARNQLVTSEDEQLVVTYPVIFEEDSSTTEIRAKSLSAFDITPLDNQVVGIGEAVGELSTTNTDDVTSFEWKYATTSGGPYTAFDPAETGATFSGSFNAGGDMYIICEGSTANGTLVSSEVKISVIAVTVAPADQQEIEVSEPGTALTVTETATADSREWMSSTTSGSGYSAILPPQSGASYTPLFLNADTYYVVCASTFGEKTIYSNEVIIVVEEPAATDASLSDIMVDGESIADFSADVMSYTVELPQSTTVVPTVTATATDANATVEVTNAADLPGTTTIDVTAEDGTTTMTYSVEFTLATTVSIFDAENINLFSKNGMLHVIADENITNSSLNVFDITGRKILSTNIVSNHSEYKINTTGIIIVQINDSDGTPVLIDKVITR